jgi:hypothetical protein
MGGSVHHMLFQTRGENSVTISEKKEGETEFLVNLVDPGMERILKIHSEKIQGVLPFSNRYFRFK